MKHKFSFTLALLLATGIFSQACGSETDVSETLGTSADSATVSAETDYLDSLGAKDFKGATYTIRAQNSTARQLYSICTAARSTVRLSTTRSSTATKL